MSNGVLGASVCRIHSFERSNQELKLSCIVKITAGIKRREERMEERISSRQLVRLWETRKLVNMLLILLPLQVYTSHSVKRATP